MSGEGKRSVAAWPKPPRPSSTLLMAQKNDDLDAEAIAEAASRPTMRFVEVKSQAIGHSGAATIRCSCSTSSATSNGARFVPATSTVQMVGRACSYNKHADLVKGFISVLAP
jgi:hypothetical protein